MANLTVFFFCLFLLLVFEFLIFANRNPFLRVFYLKNSWFHKFLCIFCEIEPSSFSASSFNFLSNLGIRSDVIICLPIKPKAGMHQNSLTVGWVSIAHMFWASDKQWELSILILINTSPPHWLNSELWKQTTKFQQASLWDLIRDLLASKANPWTILLYLSNLRIFLTKMEPMLEDFWWKSNPFEWHIPIGLNMWVLLQVPGPLWQQLGY